MQLIRRFWDVAVHARPRRRRTRRRAPISAVRTVRTSRPVRGRGLAGHRDVCDRGADALQGFRRLLGAVPRPDRDRPGYVGRLGERGGAHSGPVSRPRCRPMPMDRFELTARAWAVQGFKGEGLAPATAARIPKRTRWDRERRTPSCHRAERPAHTRRPRPCVRARRYNATTSFTQKNTSQVPPWLSFGRISVASATRRNMIGDPLRLYTANSGGSPAAYSRSKPSTSR